jgi:predicted protein tyrosine phosphatase
MEEKAAGGPLELISDAARELRQFGNLVTFDAMPAKSTEKQHVLFVCTANQQRSPTAERLYANDPRFDVRSAGTSALRGREVTREDLQWADLVVVMEERHRHAIERTFPDAASDTRIVVLGIPDVYQYMSMQLQREIRDRFEPVVG